MAARVGGITACVYLPAYTDQFGQAGISASWWTPFEWRTHSGRNLRLVGKLPQHVRFDFRLLFFQTEADPPLAEVTSFGEAKEVTTRQG
jgi:hypothetical protein